MQDLSVIAHNLPWLPIALTALAAVLGYGAKWWTWLLRVPQEKEFATTMAAKITSVALIIVALVILVNQN